jgi:hypothetical protein
VTSEYFQGGDDPIRVRANQFDPSCAVVKEHRRLVALLHLLEVVTLHHGDRLEVEDEEVAAGVLSFMRTSVIGILLTQFCRTSALGDETTVAPSLR